MSDLQKAADKVTDAAKGAAEDALDSAKEAAHSTRRAANRALDDAEEKLDEWDEQLRASSRIEDLAARAQEFANRGIIYMAESSQRARRQFHQAADATNQYVQDQPAKSLVIAAAAGAAAAVLVMLARGSGRGDDR